MPVLLESSLFHREPLQLDIHVVLCGCMILYIIIIMFAGACVGDGYIGRREMFEYSSNNNIIIVMVSLK